jgi:hypothetical protein
MSFYFSTFMAMYPKMRRFLLSVDVEDVVKLTKHKRRYLLISQYS